MKTRFFLVILFISSYLYSVNNNDINIGFKDYKGNTTYKVYSKSTKRLYIDKGYVSSIEGLEQLEELEEISINMAAFIDPNFDFLSNLENVETLHLSFVKIENTDFLKSLKNLRLLVIQSCDIENNTLILPNNIEYIEITNSHLSYIPNIISTSNRINQINLAYNNIESIKLSNETKAFLSKAKAIIMTGNIITNDETGLNTFYGNNFYNILDDEYQKFIQ